MVACTILIFTINSQKCWTTTVQQCDKAVMSQLCDVNAGFKDFKASSILQCKSCCLFSIETDSVVGNQISIHKGHVYHALIFNPNE